MRIPNPRFQRGQIPNSEKPIGDPQTSSPTFTLILALLTLSLNYVINLYMEAYKPQATVLITCSKAFNKWRRVARNSDLFYGPA